MLHLKQLRDTDPLVREAEKQSEQEEFSPMDPPDAYAPPGMEAVAYEALPPFLQKLMDDHREYIPVLDAFEENLQRIQEEGLSREAHQGLTDFFRRLDEHIIRHHAQEEKILFPLLQKRLLEKGEHSRAAHPKTAVDMLEDDHSNVLQLAAVTFNFFGLSVRLPDPASRALVLDAALEQGKTLVELVRLHLFREDNIVFPLAFKHLSSAEFDDMERQGATFDRQ
ncbi:MAG: hemerythrin domain-containing protein [Rhodothermales bacterium]